MRTFDYTVKDATGIHARPAGLLAKKAKDFESTISIEKDGKRVNISKLMAIMALGVKGGETVKVTVEGADEDAAFESIKSFFEENI
jgi:phosphocarrier protein